MSGKGSDAQRLEALIEINALINSQYGDFRILLAKIMESAQKIINTESSSLLLCDKGTGQLFFEVALGEKGDEVKKYTLNSGQGIAGWVTQANRPLLVNDVTNEPRHSLALEQNVGYKTRNVLAVPLHIKDKVIGALEVINKNDNADFNDEDLRFLKVLANQASIALQNAQNVESFHLEDYNLRKQTVYNPIIQSEFIWKSEAMEKLLNELEKIAPTDSPILILGESGTGKELLAKRIHELSNRKKEPLVRVNCAAIPSELMESELFGHVKGAFTDALRDKSGYFERADGGTLFLDEISELNLSAQGALLRILQNGYFQRVGGESEIRINVRVIAATNKNLTEKIQNGSFRQDLYYRLAVFTLNIPALRDRPEDIEILARYFLKKLQDQYPDSPSNFSLETLEALLSYRWPGNVRELKNSIERAIIIGSNKDLVEVDDLCVETSRKNSSAYRGKNLKDSINLFKKKVIVAALNFRKGNQTLAAKDLGIQRTYLSKIIKELSIKNDEGYKLSETSRR